MRRIKILSITPSGVAGVPSFITVRDPLSPTTSFVDLFHGREWINEAGVRTPFHVYGGGVPVPYGTTQLVATTFKIVGNPKYDGAYSVYTQPNGGLASSEFVSNSTRVRIDQAIPLDGVGAELTDGFVTNISTYRIDIVGEASQLVLEKELYDDRPYEFTGRLFSGWGEVLANNMIRISQNHAGLTPPANPFYGQTWFRQDKNWLLVWNGATWDALNAKHEHTQATSATTWTVTHGLEKAIVDVQVYVNTANGVKIILPQDITFVDINTLTVTLTNASTGVVRVSR